MNHGPSRATSRSTLRLIKKRDTNLLKQENAKLVTENAELKHENPKLKQIIEENAEFKAKIVKLERAVDKIEKRDQSISIASKVNDSPTSSSLSVTSQLSTPPIKDHSDKEYSVRAR
ncbi:5645_t:CDS:2 [Ambispora gerdemannii]|uniref:5645_t:CDS:1 n=1 Tax=Ambispora gerdemannii TaxID=144530 RepID=A0A9N9D030_9GLOM|nr:5645_t:CDS:2 [Ambispora gerdemannii]